MCKSGIICERNRVKRDIDMHEMHHAFGAKAHK